MLNAAVSFGQHASNSTSNISSHDPTLISGHFEINKENREKGIIEHINVNYAISPLPSGDVLHLELNTAEPTLLRAYVYDANKRMQALWLPSAKSYTYKGDMNIAKLKPGTYKLSIWSEINGDIAYEIPFQKNGKE